MSSDRPGLLNVDQYLNFPRGAQPWVLKGLLPVSGKGLLYSAPKVGKSYIALQLADAISEGGEWMNFPVMQTGRVVYLQLDTPGTTWAKRIRTLRHGGMKLDPNKVFMADASTLAYYPFDILQPQHCDYLMKLIQPLQPVLVIIDTIRKVHSGDENSSTIMSNVMSSLYKAVWPAALLVISHDKKPNPDMDKDIIMDHRGSTSVVGEMDGIIRLLKTRMYYAGRDVEQDSVKLLKRIVEWEDEAALLWEPDPAEDEGEIQKVLHDAALPSLRSKARALALLINKSDEAAMSRLRRYLKRANLVITE